MFKTRRSIKTRLTFITVAFPLLATLILVSVSLFQLQQVNRTNFLQSIEFNLHLVAELVSRDVQYLERLRHSAANHPQTTRFLLDEDNDPRLIRELHTRLNEDMMQNPVAYRNLLLRRLIVVDESLSRRIQVGFFTDMIPLLPQNLYLLGDFSSQSATSPTWFGIKADPLALASAEPVLYTINPVFHNGRIIGHIYFAVSTNVILRPLSGYRFLDGGGLYLQVGEHNYQIFESRFVETELNYDDWRPSSDTPLNTATQINAFRSDTGESYLAVSSPVGNTGMVLTQTLPMSLILQDSYFVMRLLFVVCLGILAAGLLMALYLSRIINRPVAQISKQVQAIASGNFAPNPQIEWENEFGTIGRGINKLAEEIETLMEQRLESEKRKLDLEYKMLQNQINPHFLYNSLNSIKWMATIQNATGIAEITVSLSRLLKSIAKINSSVVPLSQELALLEDYFIISHYRYGGNITSHIDIPREFFDVQVPIFTLQPIVENAIFHGIEASGGVGCVKIGAEKAENALEIYVEDNGIGMDAATIEKVLKADEPDNPGMFQKVGLNNVNARIKHEFGAEYGLRIKSKTGEFTKVIVKLPVIRKEYDV